MVGRSEDLERLISRCLDGEATAEERRQLRQLTKQDPVVRELFEQTVAIDRAVGAALRQVLQVRAGSSAVQLRPRLIQLGVFAAAAGLLLAVWLAPERSGHNPAGRSSAQARASWFAPPMLVFDRVDPVEPADERPRLEVRDRQRDWIIVPGREPGEYLLIAVDRVRTRAIRIERDF